MAKNRDFIANRVFIGCPWKNIRPKYENVIKRLENKYPIFFVLIGREEDQRAEELLDLIKRNLLSSTMAIFDVTEGNPNVSLEYGIADASDIDRVLYLNVHGQHKKTNQDAPIIADLAGQKRKQWKNELGLTKLLTVFSENHNFTKRFEAAFRKSTRNIKSRHKKRSYRSLAVKIIRLLDDKEKIRRSVLFESLLAEGYDRKDIEFLLGGFRTNHIFLVSMGRYSDVSIA